MTFPICPFFSHIVLTPVIKWSAAKTPGVAWLKAGMAQSLSVKVKNEDLISLAPIKMSKFNFNMRVSLPTNQQKFLSRPSQLLDIYMKLFMILILK